MPKIIRHTHLAHENAAKLVLPQENIFMANSFVLKILRHFQDLYAKDGRNGRMPGALDWWWQDASGIICARFATYNENRNFLKNFIRYECKFLDLACGNYEEWKIISRNTDALCSGRQKGHFHLRSTKKCFFCPYLKKPK